MAILKTVRNIIKDYTNAHTWVCIALMAIIIATMYCFNIYVLSMTHGNYNIIDILFM